MDWSTDELPEGVPSSMKPINEPQAMQRSKVGHVRVVTEVADVGGDADDVDVGLAAQVSERNSIVDAGIAVEEERQSGRHDPILPDACAHHRLIRAQFPQGWVDPRLTSRQQR